MLTTTAILALILVTNLAVSLAILITSPHRTQNRYFSFFSTTMSIWVAFVLGVIHSKSNLAAHHFIQGASIAGAWVPPSFHLLCQSIARPNASFQNQIQHAKIPLILAFAVNIMCLSPFFIKGVTLPAGGGVPDASYGLGFAIYTAYYPLIFTMTIWTFIKSMKASSGIQRVELQFVLISIAMAIPISLLIHLAAVLLKSSQPQQYGPISIIPINLVIAYGIATRRILEVGTFIRKVLAYMLQTTYLIIIYFLIFLISDFVISHIWSNSVWMPQLLAAIGVAFSMAPMHGKLQKVADKLVVSHGMDVPSTMKQAGVIFQSVTTKAALLHQFSTLLTNALKAEDVRILTKEDNDSFYTENENTPIAIPNVLNKLLEKNGDAISLDNLSRLRQTTNIREAREALAQFNSSLVAGIFSKSELRGVVLFGSRSGGRIYDQTEQDALQILCNQFAVALENARLYTEVQDSKIQNEIMLDRLVSGVVVANPDREITLFNHEAQKITGISDDHAVGKNIALLPREIYLALEVTLENQNGIRNMDASLHPDSESAETTKNIRMGSAFLFGHDGKPMGALLVFTDITELKALEEQVRRSDQLSSVGTLAAGMAHEIKNPLVTIKTFTQLLPKRYEDEDFRKDFSSLVAHEVSRIDGIVNELLSFSKPAKPHLLKMDVQETIDQTLKLIHEQLVQKSIVLQNNCKAKQTHIYGDSKLLSQALINLNLNAIDAIKDNGTIVVGTMNCSYRFANGDSPDKATKRKCLRIQITDDGKGIKRENLQRIFDPFFTSKSEGTGMGLSVAHGIISEHHGVIEVESEPGRGTTFFVYIPLFEEGAIS